MANRVKCPICGNEQADAAIKAWKWVHYDVARHQCAKCGLKFNVYKSPKSTFTVPKSKIPDKEQ